MILVKQVTDIFPEMYAGIKFHTFSGGEEHVNVSLPYSNVKNVEILARINSSSELMRLLLVTDAIRHLGDYDISLSIPYCPYSRQDRVCAPGDSFSLKLFANLINAQGYDKVYVTDAHSTVATALLENVVERPQSSFAVGLASRLGILGLANYKYIVAPDAGASKKAVDFAKTYNLMTHVDVVQALKVRDPVTGNITKTTVLKDDFVEDDVLIVDDICSGGMTFRLLARVLKEHGAGKIGLFVTHGIFDFGVDVLFNDNIDQIYTTDSFEQLDPRVHIIHQFFPNP